MKKIYMIGNTHFDPVWLWRWDEAMASIISTFRSALDRMNEDEDFVYSFATPPVFEWIKQTDPDMFEEIKARIKEGRWEICEGWWLQPDCFSAGGESYARQSLYGQRYLYENFGKYADTVFNIDSFGHNSQTPQILSKSHMKYYCLCRPEQWHTPLPSPFFSWVGKDGSRINAFRAGQYSEIYTKDVKKNVDTAEKNLASADCDEMMVFGVTNHGGAPTKQAISDVHSLNSEKPYDILFSTVRRYFEDQGAPKNEYCGELITKDYGPYTNQNKVKRLNRLAEYAALNGEKASIIAMQLLGRDYPKDKLTCCWQDIMFNQFHDILGGACIEDAYFDAYNTQGRAIQTAREITAFSLQAITRKIKMLGENPQTPWNLVIWNMSADSFSGYIEAEIQWLHEFPAYSGGIALVDAEGNEYKTQIIPEKSVIEGFRSRFLFNAEIPALGYKVFKVVKTNTQESFGVRQMANKISTRKFEVEFNKNDGSVNIYSKDLGKSFGYIMRPECYEDLADTWCFNADCCGNKLEDCSLSEISITESGIFRTVVKASLSFRKSIITLYYTFYDEENYFDVKYKINWNEKHTELKLVTDMGDDSLIVSSPFSSEKRADSPADTPMGEWISSATDGGGVSVIANGIFSYTKNGNILSLNLLRSCIFGDLRISELDSRDHSIMEQGILEGELRCFIHKDSFVEAKIANKAVQFNNPPIVICEANHDGAYPAEASFFEIKAKSVIVSAWKMAEDGDGQIIRLYEYAAEAQDAVLYIFGNKYSLNFKPYEIKTLRLKDNELTEVLITED